LSIGATAKGAHITDLRTAINAVRTLAGLGAMAFADPTLNSSITIKGSHILQLRSALDAARSTLGLSPQGYTDTTTGTIKAANINDLRQGVR
jgi:hypothetical protein